MRALGLWVATGLMAASAQERPLIAPSPMTDEEIDRLLADWRASSTEAGVLSPAEIDEEIAALRQRRDQMTTFRDSDLRAAFPELSQTDEFSYHCHVALSQPQSHTIAYRSDVVGENRVNIKYLDCRLQPDGLMCELQFRDAYYLDEPANFFSIGSGVDLSDARKVIELYRRTGRDVSDLDFVDQTGDGYVLSFGRRGCACHTKRIVRLRSFLFWESLDVDELVTSVCA